MKRKKIDNGITKLTLYACLLELEIANVITDIERDDIAERIEECEVKDE